MAMVNIKLTSKTNEDIIGVKLADGSIGKIKHTFNKDTLKIICAMPVDAEKLESEKYVFILSSGEELIAKLGAILDVSLNNYLSL